MFVKNWRIYKDREIEWIVQKLMLNVSIQIMEHNQTNTHTMTDPKSTIYGIPLFVARLSQVTIFYSVRTSIFVIKTFKSIFLQNVVKMSVKYFF